MDEARPRPFHERFDIEVDEEQAKKSFVTRAYNLIFDPILDYYRGTYRYHEIRSEVCSELSVRYVPNRKSEYLFGQSFQQCLLALEGLYKATAGTAQQSTVSDRITEILGRSETDVGVVWEPPIFVRTGARLLDERLVNDTLHWLREREYKTVLDPYEKGLAHYLESMNKPERLGDVITDMYESIEALAKKVTGRANKDLSANAEMFISKVKTSQHYKTLLKDYIAYANEYRHAEDEGRLRPQPKEPEVESFIYLTGLFIRLALRTT